MSKYADERAGESDLGRKLKKRRNRGLQEGGKYPAAHAALSAVVHHASTKVTIRGHEDLGTLLQQAECPHIIVIKQNDPVVLLTDLERKRRTREANECLCNTSQLSRT